MIKGWVQKDFAAFKGKAVKLVRCYSMADSGDGGSTSQGFHSACDDKGPTITIVKTKEGFVFGGAADKSWGSGGHYVASDSAFLFCLNCAGAAMGAAPSQIKQTGMTNYQGTLVHHKSLGPIFGQAPGLRIDTGGASAESSQGKLGYSYSCPAGKYKSEACNNYLAGSGTFVVDDYEVFVVVAV